MADDLSELKARVGVAAVEEALRLGYTITPPKAPEPVRLVTMEGSRDRWGAFRETYHSGLNLLPWHGLDNEYVLASNAADNWLVRTVNKRIIEGLPEAESSPNWLKTGVEGAFVNHAHRHDLLHLFCGEGA